MSDPATPSPYKLVPAKDGECVVWGKHSLYHPRRPREAADRRAASVPIESGTLYVIVSPLTGYGITTLISRLPATSVCVAVEVERELFDVPFRIDSSALPVVRETDIVTTAERVLEYTPDFVRRVRVVALSGTYSRRRKRYDEIIEILRSEIATRWRNKATRIHFGRKWVRHLFRNICLETPSFWPGGDPSGPVDGQPLVVCGAGESLESSLDWIATNRNRFYLMAVDTALGTLVESGIAPDGVVALEAQLINVADFLPGLPPTTDLYYDLTVHPNVPRIAAPHRRRPILSDFSPLSLIRRAAEHAPVRGPVRQFGSVGNTAVHLATLFGNGPIILVGMDFSYVAGKPHARGALSHRLSLSRSARLAGPLLFEHSAGRPKQRIQRDAGQFRVTEGTMRRQAELLPSALSGRTARSAPRSGPTIGVESVTLEELTRFLKGERGASHPNTGDDGAHSGGTTDGRSLLRSEIERIDRFEREGVIDGIEYLFYDFPDSDSEQLFERLIDVSRGKSGSTSVPSGRLLERIRIRAGSYRRYLERLITLPSP